MANPKCSCGMPTRYMYDRDEDRFYVKKCWRCCQILFMSFAMWFGRFGPEVWERIKDCTDDECDIYSYGIVKLYMSDRPIEFNVLRIYNG
jgi:hypothetical protein